MARDRPAGFRVVLSKDPVTTSKWVGGKHVGKSVYVNKPKVAELLKAWSFEHHEPPLTRELMLECLADPRIPEVAWSYRKMAEMNPQRDNGARGSLEEYQKLKAAVHRYYRENNLWFDHAALDRDFERYISLLPDR